METQQRMHLYMTSLHHIFVALQPLPIYITLGEHGSRFENIIYWNRVVKCVISNIYVSLTVAGNHYTRLFGFFAELGTLIVESKESS